MRITSQHIQAFRELSHDENPLHVDDAYSRVTQFGRPVAFGVSAILLALAHWADGRAFRLASLSADFKKPIFPDEELDVTATEAGGRVVLRVTGTGGLRARITFVCGSPIAPDREPITAPVTDDEDALLGRANRYQVDRERARLLLPRFGLAPDQLPFDQVQALLFCSWFVGVEVPGRQALFADLALEFGDAPAPRRFTLDHLEVAEDPRFRLVTITASGPGLPSLRLSAFRRPEPVVYTLAEIAAGVGRSTDFAGKTILVTGAARGFGSVFARALALHGASLVLNFRRAGAAVDALFAEIASLGAAPFLLEGDVGKEADCRRMHDALAAARIGLDVLINNALPPTPMASLAEQTAEEVIDYVNRSLAMVARPTWALLPRLERDGLVVNVSSVITRDPAPRFGAYATAKMAVEGLTRALALESKGPRFVVARPPRMRTDSTNLIQDTDAPTSAVDIARALLRRLKSLPTESGRFFAFDLDLD